MRYRLALHAYDVMDKIHIRVTVWEDGDSPDGDTSRVAELSEDLQGVGEDDPWQWARDVLVASLEGL